MRKSILTLLLTMTIQAYSQESEKKDKQQIIAVINKFFESLEKKDSLMIRQTTMDEAQIGAGTAMNSRHVQTFVIRKNSCQKCRRYPM